MQNGKKRLESLIKPIDKVELRQLRYFIKSADLLNFTEAAKSLCITQSTLSQQIKQLEEELHILLFERIGKKVYLTEAGESFLPYARKTIQDTEYGIQQLLDLQHIQTGVLKIGVTYSLSTILTNTIMRFSKMYPHIKLEVTYQTATDLIVLLKEHKVDFVLSFKPLGKYEQLEDKTLFESSLSLIVHPHHPLAALKKVSLEKIKEYPLVLPSPGLNARSVLDNVLHAKQMELSPQVELNEANILLQLVKTGHWVTILSKATIYGLEDLKAVPITEKGFEMHASLLWLKGSYQKKSAQEFIHLLLQGKN